MTVETGYLVRVQRDDKWQSLDIATLSDAEIDQLRETDDDGWRWVKALVKWIRSNVKAAEDAEAVRTGGISANAARERAGLPPVQPGDGLPANLRHARWVVVDGWPVDGSPLVIRDVGPWSEHPTITNDAEHVVEELFRLKWLQAGQRLFYFDSDGRRDELLIKDGKFAGFAPGASR